MGNISSTQERNARKKKIKITEEMLSHFNHKQESFSPAFSARLSPTELSKIFESEASSEHPISDRSHAQRDLHAIMDEEFDKAVAAITSAADMASQMTLELGEDLARIAAMRERIDRQNADNAKALKALLEGA